MAQSEDIGELAAALAKVQGAMKSAAKSAKNPFFKSNYADLPAIVEACREPLSANGFAVVQRADFNESGGGMFIHTILMHSGGQWIDSRYPINPTKNDPQSVGSAVTYARRYSLAAIVGVVSDDDDDGNLASEKPKKDRAPPPAPPTQLTEADERRLDRDSMREMRGETLEHEPDTGEVIDERDPRYAPESDPKRDKAIAWAKDQIAHVKRIATGAEYDTWYTKGVRTAITRLSDYDVGLQNILTEEIIKAQDRINPLNRG